MRGNDALSHTLGEGWGEGASNPRRFFRRLRLFKGGVGVGVLFADCLDEDFLQRPLVWNDGKDLTFRAANRPVTFDFTERSCP